MLLMIKSEERSSSELAGVDEGVPTAESSLPEPVLPSSLPLRPKIADMSLEEYLLVSLERLKRVYLCK